MAVYCRHETNDAYALFMLAQELAGELGRD
nr:hypothetical protein [Aureibacillus halotolerans]